MLELRVNSPRILFFDAVKLIGKLFKITIIAAIVITFGVFSRIGYQKIFIENDDFALKEIPLTNEKGKAPMFLSSDRIFRSTAIQANGSIFAFDVDEVEDELVALPEIASALVTRRLPGTLKIEVTERIPIAWVACPGLGIQERNISNGLLVDTNGIAFPCSTEAIANYAENLPVVFAAKLPEGAITEGEKINHEGLEYALELAQRADIVLSGTDLPDWVMVKDEVTLEMMTVGGTLCTFSCFEPKPQLDRYRKLSEYARESGRKLATINLIPKRYVPVTYLTQN